MTRAHSFTPPWNLHPSRKHEVWSSERRYFFGLLKMRTRLHVYWDVNAETGMAWFESRFMSTDPLYVSRNLLLMRGLKPEMP